MTTQPTSKPSPSTPSTLEGYLESMDAEGAPLLGHLVLYSVFDGEVTRDDLEGWFRELDLDLGFVPPALRPVDAFEKVTGPDGSRITYPLDGQPLKRRRQRGAAFVPRRLATLMVRHVSRDGSTGTIVRHIVQEVRDERETRLSYVAKLGEAVFTRDKNSAAEAGAGAMTVNIDKKSVKALPAGERDLAATMLAELREDLETNYQQRCTYLTGDRIRGVLRTYIESLHAIKVRPTGGVYFVQRQHADTLAKLRELVTRCASKGGEGSHLARIPLPDQDEMRELIIAAWRTKATEDLQRLARDIADATDAAKQSGAGVTQAAAQGLYRRFQQLQASTAEHSELLNTALADEHDALQLVHLQITSLLTQATD